MNNRTMHLTLAELANADMNSDAWVWQDDMITFCEYDDEDESDALIGLSWNDDGSAARILAELQTESDHPICGEFPHDSIVAPRGWDKVD